MRNLVGTAALALMLSGCSAPEPTEKAAAPAAPYQVYVTNEFSGDLSVIDGATRQVTATVPLGKRPRGMALSPDGKTLYIALTGSPVSPPGVDEDTLPPRDPAADGVAVFDLATRTVTRIVRGVPDPEQLAVAPSGLVYAGSEANSAVVSDAAGTPRIVPIGEQPEGVAISPDGKTLLVTLEDEKAIVLVNTADMSVRKRLDVGDRPRTATYSPDGKRAYVSNENDGTVSFIDTARDAVAVTARVPGEGQLPMGLAVSADSRTVYVATGRGGMLVALDAASGAMKAQVKVGQRPWGVALSPDGKLAFTANGPSHDVSVVDTATFQVIQTIPAGQRPWGVMVVR